jgi:hypothetical protein
MKILFEGLDYLDMVNQVEPLLSVDEYVAKMGKDSDIVTLAFTVNSELAGRDLVDWFERGYDFVLDASISDGEVKQGQHLVFVEMNRRSSVPERIEELLTDLKTLTDIKPTEWTIRVGDEEYDLDVEVLKKVITISPHEYRIEKEGQEELNEYREIAGLKTNNLYNGTDKDIQNFKNLAGL